MFGIRAPFLGSDSIVTTVQSFTRAHNYEGIGVFAALEQLFLLDHLLEVLDGENFSHESRFCRCGGRKQLLMIFGPIAKHLHAIVLDLAIYLTCGRDRAVGD